MNRQTKYPATGIFKRTIKARKKNRAWHTRRCGHALHAAVFAGALFFVGFLSVVLPKPTESAVEKRTLAPMPEFSLAAVFGGSYTRDVEKHYADTFPLREQLVNLAAELKELRGVRFDGVRIFGAAQQAEEPAPAPAPSRPEPSPDTTSQPQAPAPEPTPHQVEDDGAVGEQNGAVFVYKEKAMSIFGGSDKMAQWYASVISRYQQDWGDSVKVYNMVIPTAIEFALPPRYQGVSAPQKENIQQVYGNLDSRVTAVDAYSPLQQHAGEYLYFNADHHWTALGAYYAYTAFADAAGFEPLALSSFEKHTLPDFRGTMYAQTNDAKLGVDYVDYYKAPVKHTTVRFDKNQPFTPIPHSVWADYAKGINSYSVFLHGDFPLVRVDTENKNGKSILVIKESFGNAFVPFLLPHYQNVYIVDQRYFQLGLVDFVRQNGIGEVLFCNNIFAANTGYHIRKIEGMMYQVFVPPPPPEPEPPQEEDPLPPQESGQEQEEEQVLPLDDEPELD